MAYEGPIRLTFFFGVFAVMAVWEVAAPRRDLTTSKKARWFANIGIVVIYTALLRVFGLALAVTAAVFAESNAWGLFNVLNVPYWLAVIGAFLALDFVIYLQHVMFHAVPLLWRLHMMHHADLDLDVTSGLRFHPFEIFISMGIKVAAILLLGAPALAVVIFEIALNATSMFNHSNIYIPVGGDQLLRLLVVTPDMHRVHHSVDPGESNSNFGFNAPWWDWLCGTYRAQPSAGHIDMTIGLTQFRDPSGLTLGRLLLLPFWGQTGPHAITRRLRRKSE